MDSTRPNLKVHIVPVGLEVDRAVLPLKRLGAEKVYLVCEENPHKTLAYFRGVVRRRILSETRLGESDIVEAFYDSWNDFSSIVSAFSGIVKREKGAGNNVLINISSGSKLAAIAGTFVSLLYEVEAYYAQAEEYLRLEDKTPETRGLTDTLSIPYYRIERLSDESVYALFLVSEFSGGIKQKRLAEKLVEKKLLRDTEEDGKKPLSAQAQNNILKRAYLTPLIEKGLIELRGARRGALITITPKGNTALKMFWESNKYRD